MSEPGIVRDAETGEAVVAGTNVTVAEVLRELASGPGVEAVLRSHPELTEEAVAAAVSFAAATVQREAQYDVTTERGTGVVRESRVAYPRGEHQSLDETIAVMEDECDRLRYELDLAEGIRTGLREIREGKGVPHEQVMAELRALLDE